jgi:hypothetical protein
MSQVILSESKSVLAKLLAGENITVVHKRISTAMFDLKTRTLYVPIWEDMSGDLHDLLGGHEVGHALFTPAEGWHSAIHDKNGKFIGKFKDVLNICEDARIDKLIKRKYPGLAKPFVEGYKNLYERDFFGIKKLKDLSKLNLLDRINLYAKCGAFLIVPFNDEERELMRQVSNTETWEQVCELAARLFEKAKEEKSQINNLDDLTREFMRQFEEDLDKSESDDADDGNDDDDSLPVTSLSEDDDEDESDEKEPSASDDAEKGEDSDKTAEGEPEEDSEDDSEDDDASGASGEDDSEDDDESDKETDTGSEGGKDGSSDDDDEPQSITDRKFRSRERELITDSVEIYTYNLPTPLLDRIIVPNKVYVDNFYDQVASAKNIYVKNNAPNPITETCGKRFNQNNNRYINLLVKEFEMRKNASQYARTQVARTGELDMSKLHKYKYSNDIFKKISVVEKGKSHGMIMFVDMSGSMASMFGATMEQTLILAAFCRKVGIPFDVYGFSDDKDYLYYMIHSAKKLSREFVGKKFERSDNDKYNIYEENFHLIHLIGSNLAGNQYHRAFDVMATVALNWKNKMYPKIPLNWRATGFDLSGTPFTQALMASRPIIEKFKVNNKVDITNVIYLTDGAGCGCFQFLEVKMSDINPATGKPKIEQHVFLIDKKTKQRIELGMFGYGKSHQMAMTEFVRSVTWVTLIPFAPVFTLQWVKSVKIRLKCGKSSGVRMVITACRISVMTCITTSDRVAAI